MSSTREPGANSGADRDALDAEIDRLIEENRDRALWFLREDFRPTTDAERLRALDYIGRRADLATFRKVSELRECLLQSSSERSAG